MPPQRTLARPARLDGVGLHTGQACAVTLRPAPADSGIVFLTRGAELPAQADLVTATDRGVRLARGPASVFVVEHLLAALHGLDIDNARLEVEGPEIPAADGSALPFVRLIRRAGVATCGGQRQARRIRRPLFLGDKERYLVALPASRLEICYAVDYPAKAAGKQLACCPISPRTFAREIAPARTFAFAHELAELRRRGLAAGGSLQNAILVQDRGCSSPLRFPDELARHKALDLLGDLRLCGRPVEGRFLAVKAGHDLHLELARRLAKTAPEEEAEC
jgi:UDP-3-O-acyl N-acetylglucosamine deacetylase